MKKTKFDWKIFLLLVSVVIVIQIAYYFFVKNYIHELDKQGQFGDMFGALTALFSGFAFAGMITAIVLQTKELGYQRKELKLTRGEIKAQKKIFRIQNFNNSFYRLLDYYKSNLEQIIVTHKDLPTAVTGIEALRFTLNRFSKSESNYKKYYDINDEDKMKVYEFHLCLDIHKILLRQSRYLNTFESLLTLVDTGLDKESEKDIYWKIIDSQLTVYEVQYIFYQSLVDLNGELSRLINKSNILKTRMQSIGVKKQSKVVYGRLHNLEMNIKHKKNKLPYDRKTISKLKRKIKLKSYQKA